jgi:beta-lactamase class A
MRNVRRPAASGFVLLCSLALATSPITADEIRGANPASIRVPPTLEAADPAILWASRDPELQLRLEVAMGQAGLATALGQRTLGVALVDITDRRRPRVAAINGDRMFYAASLPKIAVLLAVFEKAQAGQLEIDEETRVQLHRMIRISSNADSTALMQKAGKQYIAEVLRSPRYRLYDETHNGGLWAGKDYASAGLWQRDPIHGLSHAATPMQAARFFYLLELGQLVSPEASLEMKQILRRDGTGKKFLEGFRQVRPRARIYRKGGTWRDFHADAALVERTDGAAYIVAALTESAEGREWLRDIAMAVDALIPAPDRKR